MNDPLLPGSINPTTDAEIKEGTSTKPHQPNQKHPSIYPEEFHPPGNPSSLWGLGISEIQHNPDTSLGNIGTGINDQEPESGTQRQPSLPKSESRKPKEPKNPESRVNQDKPDKEADSTNSGETGKPNDSLPPEAKDGPLASEPRHEGENNAPCHLINNDKSLIHFES
jgi:hypothetical protein